MRNSGTALVGRPRHWLTCGILRLTGLGDLDTGLDGEFRRWLKWRVPVMCVFWGWGIQELPGMWGAEDWLGWKDKGLTGMEGWSRDRLG